MGRLSLPARGTKRRLMPRRALRRSRRTRPAPRWRTTPASAGQLTALVEQLVLSGVGDGAWSAR